MIYYILRPIVRWTLKLYFRKIYLSGLENIPRDKAVIFASNHPSAFIEPCLLACFLPMQLHFLVRGDLFSLRWLSWLLKGTNQIPIFRHKDGLDNVRKNLQTQEKVRELFAENKAVLMFPEAHTHENIYLKPLKKGIARFSFMDHGADCYLVPIGVNFDKNIPFNSKVSVVVGKPLRVNDYKEREDLTLAKRMNNMLEDLSTEMKKCLRHIDNEERESSIQDVYRLLDNERKFRALPFQSSNMDIFEEERKIALQLDSKDETFESVNHFLNTREIQKAVKPSIIDLFFMAILFPAFCFGFILHILPDRFAKWIVSSKVKAHEFKAPVYIAVMTFQYILYLSILFLVCLVIGKMGLYFISLFILSGLFAVLYLKIWGNKLKYLVRRKAPEDVGAKLRKIIFE